MASPLALIQLISEETMHNLFPLLALRPKTVVQVRSRDDRFHQAAENLILAVGTARSRSKHLDPFGQSSLWQKCLDQFALAAHAKTGEVFEPFSIRDLRVCLQPIGEGGHLIVGDGPFLSSIDKMGQQSRRKIPAPDSRHGDPRGCPRRSRA